MHPKLCIPAWDRNYEINKSQTTNSAPGKKAQIPQAKLQQRLCCLQMRHISRAVAKEHPWSMHQTLSFLIEPSARVTEQNRRVEESLRWKKRGAKAPRYDVNEQTPEDAAQAPVGRSRR